MKNILFGPKKDWGPQIRNVLDPARYRAAFHDFADPTLMLEDFDCIVPLCLNDYAPLRARKNERVNFLIPSEEVTTLADDKCLMNDHLVQNGFEKFVPKIYGEEVGYPFVYKKSRDEWGFHSWIVRSPDEVAALPPPAAHETRFKQEYVSGYIEYVTHFLAVRGRPIYSLTFEHKFDSEYFIKGKWAKYIEHRKIETPCMEVLAAILESLNYTGTCCFNYKYAGDVPKIFEMNPRYGATLYKDINTYLEVYLNALAA
jgi:hypothetical protein